MFGKHAGVAISVTQRFLNATGKRCANHEEALAVAHGCNAVVYLQRIFMPTLKMMGVQIDASSKKKHGFFPEVNEQNGTSTSAVGRSSETRWGTKGAQVSKFVQPPDYKTTHDVFKRAAVGGEQDNYFEDAGRGDPTSDGCRKKMETREFFGMTQTLADTLPRLAEHGRSMQRWDLDYEGYKAAVNGAIIFLKGCRDDPAGHAPHTNDWKVRADEVEELGLTLKRTAGRSDLWIEKQQKLLIEALLLEHEKYFGTDEAWIEALQGLLDIHAPGVPAGVASDADFASHYDGLLDTVLARFGVGAHRFLKPARLKAEWNSFVRLYLIDSRALEMKWLVVENRKRKENVLRVNRLEDSKNVPLAERTKYSPLSKAPTAVLAGSAYAKESALQGSDDSKPMVIMLLATAITALWSQAPLESVFFQVKEVKTSLRWRIAQHYLEMVMITKVNGPSSWNGVQAGFDKNTLIATAVDVWIEAGARKIAIEMARKRKEISEEGQALGLDLAADIESATAVIKSAPDPTLVHPRFKWGKGYECTAKYGVDQASAEAAAKANHQKRTAGISDGIEHFRIKALDADRWVTRECIVDIGDMIVSVGDEVACTGWGGTIWYIGSVVGEEKKGKKVLWRVYFGGSHSHSALPLDHKRYGKAEKIDTAPGSPEQWKAGWMFVAPEREQPAEAVAVAEPTAGSGVNLD